jgi:hypothetical protein
MMSWLTRFTVAFLPSIIVIDPPTAAVAQAPIKIGLVQGFTGPLEVPTLVRELTLQETAPPIMNKR